MFHRVALFMIGCLLTSGLFAKKDIWPFICVVHSADLIVVGDITDVRAHSVRFRVKECVYGTNPDSVITVAKWKEWTCDVRLAPYAEGQRLLLFLAKDANGYAPINASTGELFVQHDSVFIQREQIRFALKEMTTSVRDLRACYRTLSAYGSALDNNPTPLVITRTCPDAGTPDPRPIPEARRWLYKQSEPYEKAPALDVGRSPLGRSLQEQRGH